jgi:DNA-directed RNA polymerase specialized sigma24 family protein
MPMSSGSVTHWIGQLRAGDADAAQKLWERYFKRLVGLARQKLHGSPRRAADEEDVALSAFDSFCRGVERGQFPHLEDRNNLWSLLMVISARKAHHLRRDQGRQRRGGGAVLGEAELKGLLQSAATEPGLDQIIGREPTPEFAAQVAEQCQHLLHRLGDAELEAVALWKMEGYTNEEIAAKLGCVLRSVERKLRLIRCIWSQEIAP